MKFAVQPYKPLHGDLREEHMAAKDRREQQPQLWFGTWALAAVALGGKDWSSRLLFGSHY